MAHLRESGYAAGYCAKILLCRILRSFHLQIPGAFISLDRRTDGEVGKGSETVASASFPRRILTCKGHARARRDVRKVPLELTCLLHRKRQKNDKNNCFKAN